MKYKIETFPNENCIEVHLKAKRRLIKNAFASFSEPSSPIYEYEDGCSVPKPRPPVVSAIWDIAGVESISLSPYSVHVLKSTAFPWAEIVPALVAAIGLTVCPDEEMEREDCNVMYGAKPLDNAVLAAI